MRKEFNRHLILSAVLGCALPTGIINGLLAYFTGHEKTFMQAAIDMNITIVAVAFIVAILVYPLMRKLSHTLPDPGAARHELPLFKSLPVGTFALSALLAVFTVLIFGIIPSCVLALFKPAPIGVLNYAIFKGIYSGIAAIPVNYIATAMAKLSVAKVNS